MVMSLWPAFLAHPVYIKKHHPLQGVAASYPFITNSLRRRRRRRCESIFTASYHVTM